MTEEGSAETTRRALAAQDRPGTPGDEQRDGHLRQELPVATTTATIIIIARVAHVHSVRRSLF